MVALAPPLAVVPERPRAHEHSGRLPVPVRQRPSRRAVLQPAASVAAAAGGYSPSRSAGGASGQGTSPGRDGDRRTALPRRAGTCARPSWRAVDPVRHPQGAGESAGRRGADPPHRRARPKQPHCDQRTRPDPAGQGQPGRSRAPCPQRRSHRTGEPAGAQPDGHDPDRGEPAAGWRIPLSPRAGADRSARSDPARQSGVEPEEPGPHEGGTRALRGIDRRGAGNPPDTARVRPPGGGGPQLRCGCRTSRQGGRAVPERSGRAPDARRAARPHAQIRRGAGDHRCVGG